MQKPKILNKKRKADLGFRSVFLILYSTSQNFGFQDFAHTNQGLSEVPLQ